MQILIGADIVPSKTNCNLFTNGDVEELVGNELIDILHGVDYRIFNLELPLCDCGKPIKKCGPNLVAEESTVNGYKALEIDLVSLANNHIMDYGEAGMISTINTLKGAGISYTGVGENTSQASTPFCFSAGRKKIGIYACTEHEFSTASKNSSGANPFDPLESYDHIIELRSKCDYVMVLYHGGKEFYRYPSPNLQKYCRKFVEKGANLVICQHSHCIGCEEKYLHGTIVYGQGNFLFDRGNDEFWKTGLLVKVDEAGIITYIPVVKTSNTVRLANSKQRQEILDAFYKRSIEIRDETTVKNLYNKFAESMLRSYFDRSMGRIRKNTIYKILNKLSRGYIAANIFKEEELLALINAVECEAHRELFLEGMKSIVK